MSFGDDALRPDGNPYPRLLVESLAPYCVAATFSWKRALLGRYDLVHLHWPEHLVSRAGRLGAVRPLLVYLLALRIGATRTPVVRTVHNLTPHSPVSAAGARALNALSRLTTSYIDMTPATEQARRPAAPSHHIPHGHYRSTLNPGVDGSDATPKHLMYFGPIHDYKGVDTLIAAFRDSRIDATLVIQGRVLSQKIDLLELAGSDPRIKLEASHASADALQEMVTNAAAVVLPYKKLENSGSVLYSLSLNRPVVVPANDATLLMQQEFGEEWVITWHGDLTASKLEDAWIAATRPARPTHVSMTGRDWETIGSRTSQVYLEALTTRRETSA